MNLPPPPAAPLLKNSIPNMSRKHEFNFPQLTQQQIEERLNKTREVFTKIGQMKALAPQLQSSPYCFIPTNSIYLNDAIPILPRIENDGQFQLPPAPNQPEIRPSPLPPK